jgi:hypothetical protein
MKLPPAGYTIGGIAASFLAMRAFGYIRKKMA